MDAFEQIIGQLLENNGYWIRHSTKIGLTKEEKKEIGKPSTPRPELDIIALDFNNNILYCLEVKSFLDSPGVRFEEIIQDYNIQEGRYKLLTSSKYRKIITKRLRIELINNKLINKHVKISYGLIAGKVRGNRENEIQTFFDTKKWFFWGPKKIKEQMKQLSEKAYEDNPVTIAAKLLMRQNEPVMTDKIGNG